MNDLIETLYRSVVDENSAAALPDAFRLAFNAGSATTFDFDGHTAQPLGPVLTTHAPEIVQRYVEYYARLDPWHAPTMTRIGHPTLGAEMVGNDSLARSEFYADFAGPSGTFHMLIFAMPLGSPGSGRFTNLSIHRPRRMEPFGAKDIERLSGLAQHLRRTSELRYDLRARLQHLADASVEAALDLVPYPAFVTDGHGRVRFANGLARQARSLVDHGGLALADRRDAPRLRRAIAEAASGGAGGTILSQGSVITAGRLPASFAPVTDLSNLALVVVRPLVEDRGALARRAVLALGLTAAEADVVAGIAAGEAPKQVAAQRGVSVATVRTLVRRALDRTGCNSLRALTGLLLRLPSPP